MESGSRISPTKTGEFELYNTSRKWDVRKRASLPMAVSTAMARRGRRTARNFSTGDKVLRLGISALKTKSGASCDKSDYGTISDGSWSAEQPVDRLLQPHRRGPDDIFFIRWEQKKITMVSSGFLTTTIRSSTDNGNFFISFRRATSIQAWDSWISGSTIIRLTAFLPSR